MGFNKSKSGAKSPSPPKATPSSVYKMSALTVAVMLGFAMLCVGARDLGHSRREGGSVMEEAASSVLQASDAAEKLTRREARAIDKLYNKCNSCLEPGRAHLKEIGRAAKAIEENPDKCLKTSPILKTCLKTSDIESVLENVAHILEACRHLENDSERLPFGSCPNSNSEKIKGIGEGAQAMKNRLLAAARVADLPGVFGVDIDQHGELVQIVQGGIEWLNTNHLASEGLWRTDFYFEPTSLHGSTLAARDSVRGLIEVVNQERSFLVDDISNFDGSLMTGLLIKFLQQIPGGLVNAETIGELLVVFDRTGTTSEGLIEFIKNRISENKFTLLQLLLDHWRLVVATHGNKMVLTDSWCEHLGSRKCIGSVSNMYGPVFAVADSRLNHHYDAKAYDIIMHIMQKNDIIIAPGEFTQKLRLLFEKIAKVD